MTVASPGWRVVVSPKGRGRRPPMIVFGSAGGCRALARLAPAFAPGAPGGWSGITTFVYPAFDLRGRRPGSWLARLNVCVRLAACLRLLSCKQRVATFGPDVIVW